MSPVLLLAIAVALFATPATHLLVVSLLGHQGKLGTAAVSEVRLITIWCIGACALLLPFALPRLMRSSPDHARLLTALVLSVAASVVGVALTLVTGDLLPTRVFVPASMVAMLGWSWSYRACFRADPPGHVLSRYTTLLVAVSLFTLAWAAGRIALWERLVDPGIGPGPDGFIVFLDLSVGLAGLAVARLRKRASPYAEPATWVLSGVLFFVFPLGLIVALYWLLHVRVQEGRTRSGAPPV